MALEKIQFLCYLIIVLVSCHVTFLCAAKEDSALSNLKPSSILLITTNRTTTEKPDPNRSGRAMKIFYNSPKPKRYSPPTQRRSDNFPPHLVFQRRPFRGGGVPHLQMIRRVQNNIPTIRQGYDGFKSSRYSPIKEAALGGGLGPQYRPQFGSNVVYRPDGQAPMQIHQHPNSLNQGGVHSQQYVQNFKASPVFSGKAIVRPVAGDQQAQQQHDQYLQQQQQYTQQQQQQKYQQARDQYYTQQLQQQEQLKQQLNQREQISQQYFNPQQASKPFQDQLQQSNNYQINLPLFSKTAPQNSYSVYEEPDLAERAQLQIASAHNQDVTGKEAQEYLNFMSTNEYFLPKREPNYKKLDEERDRFKYQQTQQQQQRSQFPQTQQQQQRQIKYSKPAYDAMSSPTSALTSAYSKPIEASQLFYHGDSSPSSTIVRGSYQAGNNVFVVNSDGNKAIKHVVPNPLATTPRTVTSTQRYSLPLNRTPEPIRFEFTERDAISPATYTNSPTGQSQKNAVGGSGLYVHSTPGTPTGSTTPSLHYDAVRPIDQNRGDTNSDDDPEDEEDMQEASSSDIFGRVPVKVHTKVTSEELPSEQKDTEDYCEKICSNIQDDDEEVVCGSDGYMYTSEAQMECYASCLHIDVTIQGKGSCSAR